MLNGAMPNACLLRLFDIAGVKLRTWSRNVAIAAPTSAVAGWGGVILPSLLRRSCPFSSTTAEDDEDDEDDEADADEDDAAAAADDDCCWSLVLW
jgi:hypothetical protein